MNSESNCVNTLLVTLLMTSLLSAQRYAKDFHEIQGQTSFVRLGNAVAGVGDVNGDGHDDFVIATHHHGTSKPRAGRIRVYSGRTLQMLFGRKGQSQWDELGSSVGGAGDFNNDGIPDIIVGARGDDTAFHNAGSATVYSGNNGTVLHRFYGGSVGASFGMSVAGLGDLNGDGHDDVIVGSPQFSQAGVMSGGVDIYSGSDQTLIYHITGSLGSGSKFGRHVANAGDTNKDGIKDFLVSAPVSGVVYLYSGQDGSLIRTWTGAALTDDFGASIAAAGDLNQDGYDDILVGAPGAPNPLNPSILSGRVDAFSGFDGSILLSVAHNQDLARCGDTVCGGFDVDLDGISDIGLGAPGDHRLVVYSGKDQSVLFERSFDPDDGDRMQVATVGDMDSDGISDLVVGMPLASTSINVPGRFENGHAYTFRLTSSDLNWNQGIWTNLLSPIGVPSFVSGGDANGDGVDDYLLVYERTGGPPGFPYRCEVRSGVDHSIFYALDVTKTAKTSHSFLGDLNGDGCDDFALGTREEYSSGIGPSARVYSGIDGTTLHQVTPTVIFAWTLGEDVGSLGDVNGDGVPDFYVSSLYEAEGFSGADGQHLFHHLFRGTDGDYNPPTLIGDVNADGVEDFLFPTRASAAGNSTLVTSELEIYSGANGNLIKSDNGQTLTHSASRTLAGDDINGDGVRDFYVSDYGPVLFFTTSPPPHRILAVSGADFSILWISQVRVEHERFLPFTRRAEDLNGDGIRDVILSMSTRYFSPGSPSPHDEIRGSLVLDGLTGERILAVPRNEAIYEHTLGVFRDVNDDGIVDLIDASSKGRVVLSPAKPSRSYRSDAGTHQLCLTWRPVDGKEHASLGSLSCIGAASGSIGLFGVSLASADFVTSFGFPLLIANDPINLLGTGFFGFDANGEFVSAPFSRINQFLVGGELFIQFYEFASTIRSSNGLRLSVLN